MARILLAEPDRAIREFIAGILTEFGHDVLVCDNVVEASVWLATSPIDVLVTDMVLRGEQGSMLSRSCAALGIPTVTLTGREFHADQTRCKRPPRAARKAVPVLGSAARSQRGQDPRPRRQFRSRQLTDAA